MHIFMPADTRAALGDGATRCDSVALLQQKFPFIDTTRTIKPHHRIALDQFLPDGPADLNDLRAEARRDARPNLRRPNPNRERRGQDLLAALAPFTREVAAHALPLDDSWQKAIPTSRRRTLTLSTASRLIVGHANGVIENSGLTLHRTHGVPIIPGAAVKNTARRASLEYDYSPEELADLFGTAKQSARIAFLAALPAAGSSPILEYEISTPHYKDYYGGAPGNAHAPDTENPNIVVFPAVAEGERFDFAIVLTRPTGDAARDDELLNQAESLLHEGLTQHGIGAKTSAGHGYFTPDSAKFGKPTAANAVFFMLLTPAITAGARQDRAEVRVASIRGQLRQIYRMLGATPTDEHALFGGIGRNLPPAHPKRNKPVASAIALRLERIAPPAENDQPHVLFCPHNPNYGSRPAVPRRAIFKLAWRDRFVLADPSAAASRAKAFQRVLDTWLLLGGLGCRSTRAAGSVWKIKPGKPPTLLQFTPDEFTQVVRNLTLPATLRVTVLDRVIPPAGVEECEFLRGIATDTVNGNGPGLFSGDPLGFIAPGRNPSRKVSPLKLKIGVFSDGYRLIATWDDRNGRGGDLKAAITAMVAHGKRLGTLLAASGLP